MACQAPQLLALRNRGLYKVPLGEGKHDITCPWVQEHTNQADGGTAYFEPDDIWSLNYELRTDLSDRLNVDIGFSRRSNVYDGNREYASYVSGGVQWKF